MSCHYPGFSLEKTNQPVDHGDSRCWNFHQTGKPGRCGGISCVFGAQVSRWTSQAGRLETIPGASPPLSWWGSRSVNNMSPFYSRVKREYIKSILKEAFRNPHGVDFGSGIFAGRQVNLSGVLSFFGVSLPNGKTN